MRIPLWIIDFNKEGHSKEFLDRWWKAYGQNADSKPHADDLWYFVTRTEGKSFEEILDDAGHLTLVRDGRNPLIPAFNKTSSKPSELNVVFLGDVTDENSTIPYFHFWASRLRLDLLKEETQWTTITRVHFYGMLWRPNTAAVAPGVSAKTRGFLQELNMLMRQDVNHVPFRSVAFVESSDRSKDKAAALEKMNLAVLHLSAMDFLGDRDDHRFVDLSASGVFYESAVHAQQGEFLLSNALVDKIANSREKEFFNPPAAKDFVDGQTEFLDVFSNDTLVGELTDECPTPNAKTYAFDIEPSISPWSTKLRKVWAEYYCDFIPNYKKNLVNRVKRGLKTFTRDYRGILYSNQKDAVTKVADLLQKQVFHIFTNESASKYVSLAQAEEILSCYKQKIEDNLKEADDVRITPFAIPSELKLAAEQARAENRTPEEAMTVLESRISHHPVAVFALLVRSVVLGGLLGYLLWSFFPLFTGIYTSLALTALAVVFPTGVALLQFRNMRIRIEALKQQYVGVMLLECEEKLKADILKCLKVTYEELQQYCGWLKKNKLDFLKSHLSVLSPSDFSFVESSVLQPLVRAGNTNVKEENLVLIPPVKVDAFDEIQLSGSFGYHPILNFEESSPLHQIEIEGVSHDIKSVVKNNKHLAKLVKQLMGAKAVIKQSIEQQATFHSRDVQGKTLLLLDVSGSMAGQPLEDLKNAVRALEESYCVEWIAFDDQVIASSFEESANIDTLQSGGGTNFIPPIKLAVEKIHEDLYDEIILISDGSPFETTDAILSEALRLEQPLNTISIGQEGASVMKELSVKTGGVQIVVDNVKEIVHWEGQMKAVVQLGENGVFSFGELIAKCHIPGCARALHHFVSSQIQSEAASLSSLIIRYPGRGLSEWEQFTHHGSSLTQTAEVLDEQFRLGVDNQASQDKNFASVLGNVGNPVLDTLDAPLMLATLIYVRGVALRDLLWAGMDEKCADLNDRNQLETLLFGNPTICNLYNRPIR